MLNLFLLMNFHKTDRAVMEMMKRVLKQKLFTIGLLLFANLCFADTTAYFFPADFNGVTQTPTDVTEEGNFPTICSGGAGSVPQFPGLDMIRSFAGIQHCAATRVSGELAQSVDYIFLVDDTRELSAYLLAQLEAQQTLQSVGGRRVVRPTVVRFTRGSLPPLNILVVGEMAYRRARTTAAWLAQINERSAEGNVVASAGGSDPTLFILGRDGDWVVFSRLVFRPEVINYFWQDRFTPTADELRAREGTLTLEGGMTMEIDDTHWHLDYTPGFTSGRVYSSMTPELRQRLDNLVDLTDYRALAESVRPPWIPQDVWQDALEKLRTGRSGVHVYDNRSSAQTDIIIVIRDGRMGAYADAIEDEDRLYALYEVIPPSTWEEFTGQSSRQASIRWFATANSDYNSFMRQQVNDGRTVRDARTRYADHARMQLVVTLLRAYRDVTPGGRFSAPAGVATSEGLEVAMDTLGQIIDFLGLTN